jgi:hypothetical protein
MPCLVDSFLEPFQVKDLCSPGRWHPQTGTQTEAQGKEGSGGTRKHNFSFSSRIWSHIEREMGQQVSKVQVLFTEILCSMLCSRGCKVS